MCLVACGSADAYYHMGIHCWDMAGGAAVVTEAGGVLVDISGESLRKALQTPTDHSDCESLCALNELWRNCSNAGEGG